MMKYKVKMTDYASSQIEETAAYILRLSASRTVARKWVSKLRKAILSLDEMPLRYVLTDEKPWRTKGVHKMVVDNFIVYYWVDEKNKTVWVLAVVYGRQDQTNALKNIPE